MFQFNERAAIALGQWIRRCKERKEMVRLCSLTQACRLTALAFPGVEVEVLQAGLKAHPKGLWSDWLERVLLEGLATVEWTGKETAFRSAPKFPDAPAQGSSRGCDVLLVQPGRALQLLGMLSRHFVVSTHSTLWWGSVLRASGGDATLLWWTALMAQDAAVEESAHVEGALTSWQTRVVKRTGDLPGWWQAKRVDLRSPEGLVATLDFDWIVFSAQGGGAPREWPWAVLKVQRNLNAVPKWYNKVLDLPVVMYSPNFSLQDVLQERFAPEVASEDVKRKRLEQGLESSASADEALKGRVLHMAQDARTDPKVYMTLERTLFSWTNAAVFVGLTAISLFNLNTPATRYGGLVFFACAVVLALYPLVRWRVRLAALLGEDRDLRPFVDFVGPAVAIAVLVGMVVTVVVTSIFFAGVA